MQYKFIVRVTPWWRGPGRTDALDDGGQDGHEGVEAND